ncbi:MAG: hypothetical protein BWY74_02276 [Firmicutes bacterium ADurb.Bin419]|nr:MAG: hypothetical protein BWY74_02276 [Firmicutes bacterium ADurb.Bin419]
MLLITVLLTVLNVSGQFFSGQFFAMGSYDFEDAFAIFILFYEAITR